MTYKIPVASTISNQFPEFVKEDYPRFVRFVELYYEYVKNNELEGIGENFTSIRDIDVTLDKFIDSLWKEFGINVPRTNIANDTHFLKHIKEFYSTKGSEESFRILFRHFFNTEIDIHYPQEYIFKSSDGEWVQDISFVVEVMEGDIYDIVGQLVSISTSLQTVPVIITRVKPLQQSYEVFISANSYLYSLLNHGDILTFNGVVAKLVKSIKVATVGRTGTGFYLGQLFSIPSVTGTSATIKVTKVDDAGNLLNVTLINYGYGYDHDFYASISSNSLVETSISEFPTIRSKTLGFLDYGFISTNPYWEETFTSPTYCGEILQEFYTDTTSQESIITDANTAIIRIQIGTIRKYQGYYKSDKGFLSNSYKLQDSFYYQIYSYVISSVESINTYRDIIKTLVHPTGTKLFGEQKIINYIPLITSLEILNSFIQISAQDSTYVSDEENYLLNKSFSEQLGISSEKSFTIYKQFTDTLSINDTTGIGKLTSAADNMSISDSKEISIGKNFSDTLNVLGYIYWDATYTSSDYVTSEIPAIIEYADATYNILLNN